MLSSTISNWKIGDTMWTHPFLSIFYLIKNIYNIIIIVFRRVQLKELGTEWMMGFSGIKAIIEQDINSNNHHVLVTYESLGFISRESKK